MNVAAVKLPILDTTYCNSATRIYVTTTETLITINWTSYLGYCLWNALSQIIWCPETIFWYRGHRVSESGNQVVVNSDSKIFKNFLGEY